MKTRFSLLLLGLLTVAANATELGDQLPPTPQGKSFKLVWQDEFDGDKLDESKWDVPNNRRRDGWWSSKAASVDNGHLAVSTLKDGDQYLDACVRTRASSSTPTGITWPASNCRRTPPLLGILVVQLQRRQDRQSRARWNLDRHHGEAVAGRPCDARTSTGTATATITSPKAPR